MLELLSQLIIVRTIITTLHLQAMFPHLQHNQPDLSGPTSHEDRRLFCLAASDFYAGLTEWRQKEKFIQTFEEVSSPASPYSELLATIEHRCSSE